MVAGRKGPAPRSVAERFWPKVEKTETCWLWKGGRKKVTERRTGAGGRTFPSGVFRLSAARGTATAHRVSYMLEHGFEDCTLEDFGLLEHECDNHLCVRPSHLKESDFSSNLRSMWARGRRNLKELLAWFEERRIENVGERPIEGGNLNVEENDRDFLAVAE